MKGFSGKFLSLSILLSVTLEWFLCATFSVYKRNDSFQANVHKNGFVFDGIIGKATRLVAPEIQEEAVRSMIRRVIPKLSKYFIVHVGNNLDFSDNLDYVKLQSVGNFLYIRSNTGVSASYGFHYYLKYFCKAQITWNGHNLHCPKFLPKLKSPVLLRCPNRFRYYQNVCTSSYSFVWWNWKRWEREIDWMALNGINLGLAFTGQEAIWKKLYLYLGLTSEEINAYFGGPGFLAWQRMGNIQTWGGPLPSSWIQKQLRLQHQILNRMRSFGMITVLPGFAGHVPEGLKRVFPQANFTYLKSWGHFKRPYCCTLFLQPTDPLFQKIAHLFIQYQRNEYNGTDHVYSIDIFNEMTPPSSTPTYLSDVSTSVWNSLEIADKSAVWLMQSWFFNFSPSIWKPKQINAFLKGIPIGRLIVLDLYAEKIPLWKQTNFFAGHYFIWCMLNNFGGNYGIIGAVENIIHGPLNARYTNGSTMVGIGMTPEGIGRNYMMFDLTSDMAWRQTTFDIASWTKNFVRRRYGTNEEHSINAWVTLTRTLYNCTQRDIHRNTGFLLKKPSLTRRHVMWYKYSDLRSIWSHLLNVGCQIRDNELYRYDLVDIGRQALQDISYLIYERLRTGYKFRSARKVKHFGHTLVEIAKDLNMLLATHADFLLGTWLENAKSNADNAKEELLFEFNAKNQITLWGPNGNIMDYANKDWSGLVSTYYLPKWKLFVESLLKSLSEKRTFNQTKFNIKVLEQAKRWSLDRKSYRTKPVGDLIAISNELFAKYENFLQGDNGVKIQGDQVQCPL